jgi:hypothetical protein
LEDRYVTQASYDFDQQNHGYLYGGIDIVFFHLDHCCPYPIRNIYATHGGVWWLVKHFRLKDREQAEYIAGKLLLWFGYFVCLGLLLLMALHG